MGCLKYEQRFNYHIKLPKTWAKLLFDSKTFHETLFLSKKDFLWMQYRVRLWTKWLWVRIPLLSQKFYCSIKALARNINTLAHIAISELHINCIKKWYFVITSQTQEQPFNFLDIRMLTNLKLTRSSGVFRTHWKIYHRDILRKWLMAKSR